MARVLVVDDEPDVRTVLVALLQDEGHTVVEIGDGEDLLDATIRHDIELILLDISMPKMDGFEALRFLRANPSTRRIPVIIITAKGTPQDRTRAKELWASDYINKPWMPGEIELRVKWALKGKSTVPAVPWDKSGASAQPAGSGALNVTANGKQNAPPDFAPAHATPRVVRPRRRRG